MAQTKPLFGSTTAFTITLNSLASSGTVGRQSTAVDNSELYLDALVDVTIAYPNAAPTNDQAIYLYAYGSVDGSTFPEGVTGTNGAYTFFGSAGALRTAMRLIGVIPAVQNTTVSWGPFAVAPAFDGVLPIKWGIIVLNHSGQTLSASGNAARWRGVSMQSV